MFLFLGFPPLNLNRLAPDIHLDIITFNQFHKGGAIAVDKSNVAILFYGKTKEPITFTKYKKYNKGTGYIALYDADSQVCFLCRTLDEREVTRFMNNANKLILKGKCISEQFVVVINANLNSIADADNIITGVYNKQLW